MNKRKNMIIMKWKNKKKKIQYIEEMSKWDNQLIQQKFSVLLKLSKDKNPEVREMLAENLVLFECEEAEEILYNMLSDKNRMVRLEALDSICVGRSQKAIEKVATMMSGQWYLIRMYAVMTLFDLLTNASGVNEQVFKQYQKIKERHFSMERNPRVLLAYYRNEYYMNHKEGLYLLEKFYVDAMDDARCDLIWPVLHILEEIKSEENQNELQRIVSYKKEKLLPVQVAFIEEMENENIKRKILVLDKNNTYLSHIVALTLCALYDEKREEVSTAGIEVGNVRLEDIKAFCNRNHIPYWGKFESKKITESYTYDYIVCINMKLEKNTFSKIKTIYYENINENDNKQIWSMCQEIKMKTQSN